MAAATPLVACADTLERLMSITSMLPQIADIDRLREFARLEGDKVSEKMCLHALGFAGYGRLGILRQKQLAGRG